MLQESIEDILKRAYCLDFETTDVEPTKAKVCEAALWNPYGISLDYLVNPGVPIPPETSAVHHITDDDVKDAPSWESVKRLLTTALQPIQGEPLRILVAHNAKYEQGVLGEFCDVLWVCTYKCALRVWPEAPSHKNEVLRYYLGLTDTRGRNSSQRSHSALHDAQVTYAIFQELLKHATIDDMIAWTEEPALFPKFSFGKFRGQPWSAADAGYLNWIIKQSDMDPDVKWNAQRELDRRRR